MMQYRTLALATGLALLLGGAAAPALADDDHWSRSRGHDRLHDRYDRKHDEWHRRYDDHHDRWHRSRSRGWDSWSRYRRSPYRHDRGWHRGHYKPDRWGYGWGGYRGGAYGGRDCDRPYGYLQPGGAWGHFRPW